MSTEKERQALPPRPTSEPVKNAEATPPDAVTGSGALEKRASVFPVPSAELTDPGEIMADTGPVTGTPPAAASPVAGTPTDAPSVTPTSGPAAEAPPADSSSGE